MTENALPQARPRPPLPPRVASRCAVVALALVGLVVVGGGCGGTLRGAPSVASWADPERPGGVAPEVPPRAAYHFAYAHMAWNAGQRKVAEDHLRKALLHDPDSAFLAMDLGRVYDALGDPQAAHGMARRATALDPEFAGGWRLLGELELGEGRLPEAEVALRRATALEPLEETAHFYLFRTLAKAGRTDDALAALDDYRRSAGREDRALLLRAEFLDEIGRPDDALAAFRGIFEVDPYSRAGLAGIVELYRKLGRPADAIVDLERLAAAVPDNPSVRLELVGLYNGLGRHEDAVRLLRGVYEEDPSGRAEYAIPLARLLIQLLRLDEAAEVLRGGLEAAPGEGELTVLRGELLRLRGEEEAALAEWSAVPASSRAAQEALYRAVLLRRARGEVEEAERLLAEAWRADPADSGLLRWRISLLREAGRHDEAGALVEELRALDPDAAEVEEAWLRGARGDVAGGVEILERRIAADGATLSDSLALAELLRDGGRIGEAIEALLRALRRVEGPDEEKRRIEAGISPEEVRGSIDADRVTLLVQIGFLHGLEGRVDESIAWTRKVLEIDPADPTALNNIGYTLVEAGRDLEEAERMILKALEVEPLNASYLDSLGWARYRQGRFADAVGPLEQAALREPREAVILEHLGDAYLGAGRAGDAIDAWRRALRAADTGGPEARDVAARVPGKIRAAGGDP